MSFLSKAELVKMSTKNLALLTDPEKVNVKFIFYHSTSLAIIYQEFINNKNT